MLALGQEEAQNLQTACADPPSALDRLTLHLVSTSSEHTLLEVLTEDL